jgi:indolepyruvate ferredoxin oxidoreductase
MGAEGANWIGEAPFSTTKHVFQNLGDGTFYHSGSVAIRQAVAAGTNITFKILYNDAVAMTGGQPVDGPISVHAIAHSVRAEGVERIALVSDDPDQFDIHAFPGGTTFSHRREMDTIQRELRDIPGVTVLIYAQTCATEKRRRRKRGLMDDPKKFVVINDLVCEGCGDCSVESNCLSVIPKETPFGRKRQIDQNSCNKDYSCVNGFCPSFVTVEGERQKPTAAERITADVSALTAPAQMPIEGCFDLLVTGVGGTGVVTVGALITMAAHLEGKGTSVLDFMGFAQKFGPVLSYIRIAEEPAGINQVRIERARADALIGCDLVVSSSPKASRTYGVDRTHAVVNLAEMATGDFVRHRDANLKADLRVDAVRKAVRALSTVDANQLAASLMGDTIYANVLLLGYAWQRGLVPVSEAALMRAIELNAVKVDDNKQAFDWGRVAAVDPAQVTAALAGQSTAEHDATLDDVIRRRADFLVDYQDRALADRFEALVSRVRAAESAIGGDALSDAVARSYFKLLAYKDEYEVGRLHTSKGFLEKVRRDFGRTAKVRFHLAPPILNGRRDARGRPLKKEFGAWMIPVFKLLAAMRRLRGTPFDVFGMTAERRMERALIGEFEATVDALLAELTPDTLQQAREIAAAYMDIRGYGPVKEEAVTEVRARVADALEQIRHPVDAAA